MFLAAALSYVLGRRGIILLVGCGLLIIFPQIILEAIKNYSLYTSVAQSLFSWVCSVGIARGHTYTACSPSILDWISSIIGILTIVLVDSGAALVGLATGLYFQRKLRNRLPSVSA